LSYADLRTEITQRATWLRDNGIGPGARVVVALPRSPATVVAMFAVWSLGATVVPVDSRWPPARVELLVQRVGAQIVVGQGEWGGGGDSDRVRPTTTESLAPAYLTFTSGSTGAPKAVAVSHRALGNYLAARASAVPLTPGFRVLAMASLGVDVALRELIWPLTAGGSVITLPDDERADTSRIVAALREHRVNVVHVLPSLLEILVSEPGFTDLPELLVVHSGAERLPVSLVRAFREHSPAALHHSYGPTEAAISVTHLDCATTELDGLAVMPLGAPVDNVDILIRDESMRPVPAGTVGELCLAGPCLADGYVDEPEATRAAFPDDPTEPGRRLYRTGDRAVLTPEGQLFFRGRRDDQLKVRGYRIEPAEVEAALCARPEVSEALVSAGANGEELVARIVLRGQSLFDSRAVRSALADLLPAHLVPDRILTVAALPRTPAGKLDRVAGARVAEIRPPSPSAAPSPAPPGPLDPDTVAAETTQIWCSVLNLPTISPTDSFFDLGGNSMNAMRITSRLRKRFGSAVQVRWLFDHETIAGLTKAICAAAGRAGA
jgi:amino acid adenylation domain-containing protein